MTEFDTSPSNGVFDPGALQHLIEAFEKAERHLDRLRPNTLVEIDRDSLARRIVSEARDGETQPELVWRAAVAKALLETRTETSAQDHDIEKAAEATAVAADLPPAGPHAAPEHTNADATPGAGALPADTHGDDVDPGAG